MSLGRVGAIFALEASRLARSNLEWHRLIEICALTRTLVIDEEGCYAPADFNDALLLGLKATIAQAGRPRACGPSVPVWTNGARRDRAAHASHWSSMSGASSGRFDRTGTRPDHPRLSPRAVKLSPWQTSWEEDKDGREGRSGYLDREYLKS